MSERNVQRAYRAYDAFNRRDWDAFLPLMDDEVEVESRLVILEGSYHGHQGLRRWWNDFSVPSPTTPWRWKRSATSKT
jgi:hypothetical protein